jgi:hypothetical protein
MHVESYRTTSLGLSLDPSLGPSDSTETLAVADVSGVAVAPFIAVIVEGATIRENVSRCTERSTDAMDFEIVPWMLRRCCAMAFLRVLVDCHHMDVS